MKQIYAKLVLAAVLACASANTWAVKKWQDVTSYYLSNPSFTTANYDEWEVEGTASSIKARAGCMEMWSGTINAQKTLTGVPNGHYRLRMQAFYRTQSQSAAYTAYKNGTEEITGYMFANSTEKQLLSQYSYYLTENPQYATYNVDGVYYPNSMEVAEILFTKGVYWNEIEVDVTDSTLQIGVYNDNSVTDNWLVFDNVTIERQVEAGEATSSSVVINEIMAANVDYVMSPAYNFDGWVEIYNPTDNDVWLDGYYLSDDSSNLLKWEMPSGTGIVKANGYKAIWLGSNSVKTNQAPFKLDCEGGTIYISDPLGTVIAKQTYPEARSRMSWARTTDGGTSWKWTATPTPEATNNNVTYASAQLDAPEVTPDGQVFTTSVSITVTIPDGATLRYTVDGTTPTETNGSESTTGKFNLYQTKTYRFRLFKDGYLPSPVVTRSYIKSSRTFELPVIVVSTKDEYLYNDTIGVYTKGTNGRTGNGQSTPANWNMDWDRPVNFQYITPEDGAMAVNQDVDFSISGGWTRSNSLKSFKLKADRVYEGQNAYSYQFFQAKPYLKNKTLQVRAGGNDTGSKIKDAAIQTIMQRAKINLDLVSYQPAVHYINGVYKGLINVREPNNKDFAYANFGYSKDELEVYEQSPDSGAYMMLGSPETLLRLVTLSETSTEQTSYDEIKRLLDIDEYANYMAACLYLGSWDWPDNNVKAYRKAADGKYRIVVFDLDAAFGTDSRSNDENGNAIYCNTFRWIDGMQWHWYDYIYDEGLKRYGEIKFCTFFLNMLNNDDFRRKFIDAFCVIGGSVFDPDTAEEILTELGDRVRPTMETDGGSPDSSLNEIRNALKGRVDDMTDDMISYERLQLTNTQPQSVTLSADNENAKLYVGEMIVPYSKFNGNLFAPTTLKAVAPAGYDFAGWKKYDAETTVSIAKGSDWTYYDQGSLDDEQWQSADYDDSSWSSGASPLGYGKDIVTTTLNYGDDTSNKYSTYYFRKKVNVASDDAKSYKLEYVVDDGFVVYVNGTEAGRYNLSDGTVSYSTYASTADSNPDSGTMTLDASLFKQGDNIIAVEVHNNTANSSDIVWNAQLSYSTQSSVSEGYYSTDAVIDLPEDTTLYLQACFTPKTDSEKTQSGVTPVAINEVSGANSIYMNDYFKRNDWLELYNTTDEEIDIEGMYFSNDVSDPYLYQITKGSTDISTVIPAHGFKIIWCDKLDNKTMLHAPFKISASGGELVLTAKDKSWSNSITFPAHEGDETVGRYPDGNSSVYLMNIPTIEDNNIYTSYADEVTQNNTNGIAATLSTANQGLEISYAANALTVRSSQTDNVTVTLYNTAGQEIMQKRLSMSAGMAVLDLNSIVPGCYIARAAASSGRTAACKFVIGRTN